MYNASNSGLLNRVVSVELETVVREARACFVQKQKKFERLFVSKGRWQYAGTSRFVPEAVREFLTVHLIDFFKKETGYKRYSVTTGFLETEAGAPDGEWHRDVYPMAPVGKDDDPLWMPLAQSALPLHYLTLLLELDEKLDDDKGFTEFKDGTGAGAVRCRVFDGRCIHRGTRNNSSESRLIFFATITPLWYRDYTVDELRWEERERANKPTEKDEDMLLE